MPIENGYSATPSLRAEPLDARWGVDLRRNFRKHRVDDE